MAEEFTKYLGNLGIRSKYIHSDVDTLERVEIMRDLRMGVFDVLVGVNLLREGLDLPEVSLVAILDADKEGFLRNDRALIQTIGRAARNVHGRAILYADKITASMQRAIDETNRHREKQIRYNQEHGIVPRQIVKSTEAILGQTSVIDLAAEQSAEYYVAPSATVYKEPEEKKVYRSKEEIKKALNAAHRNMQKAAKELDYMAAAKYRDEVKYLQQLLENR
jgi:excinuclease ABC subunit B